MHIIFGKDQARALESKYTVLELDTLKFLETDLVTQVYCIIENISILELPEVERMKNLHAELINNYGKQNWSFCLQAMEHLRGKWGGEVDSFYLELHNRIQKLVDNPPAADWSPIIQK